MRSQALLKTLEEPPKNSLILLTSVLKQICCRTIVFLALTEIIYPSNYPGLETTVPESEIISDLAAVLQNRLEKG